MNRAFIISGKLKLVSSGGDIEYLRNIFVQYLNTITTASASSKNILRAMGMVSQVLSSFKFYARFFTLFNLFFRS